MSANPFVLPASSYKRNINTLQQYVDQAAHYLNKMTGRPIDQCEAHVKKVLGKGGKFEFKDPKVLYLERENYADRSLKETTLTAYFRDSLSNKELIAPTLTTYVNPEQKQSMLVDFIDDNVKGRSVAKKAKFKAEQEKNWVMYAIKDIEQTLRKLGNNALSGAHVSASNPLCNKSAHSTLTSNCRSTSGYGNANNEKFLTGNRHYWSPEIVLNNIVSITLYSDYDKIKEALDLYGIRCPTYEETMDCITYSTKLYWTSKAEMAAIERCIGRLSDIERAAFVYTGDMYHLMKYNDEVVRKMITKLASRIPVEHPEADDIFAKANEDMCNLARMICSNETRGKDIKDLKGSPAYGILASTTKNVENTLQEYACLISAFWVTPNVPASVAYFPDSIRRSAVTSDTDSTIFTVQDWVKWYCGEYRLTEETYAVAASVIFLAAQDIIHVLALMSANYGIGEKRLFQIAMKNEYFFDVFIPTDVAKHYYAIISCQEGAVKAELEKEIKGVHLKSSNMARAILKEAHSLMEMVMYAVRDGKKVKVHEIMDRIANMERMILDSIKSGNSGFFKRGQIKIPESYKAGEDSSAYKQYVMWQEIFAPKYGDAPPLPYVSTKVSVDLKSATQTRAWLDGLKDQELADRARAFLKKSGKNNFGTAFMLPTQCVRSKGMPSEVFDVIGSRKIIIDNMAIFYLVLKSMGIFINTDTRLVSDTY